MGDVEINSTWRAKFNSEANFYCFNRFFSFSICRQQFIADQSLSPERNVDPGPLDLRARGDLGGEWRRGRRLPGGLGLGAVQLRLGDDDGDLDHRGRHHGGGRGLPHHLCQEVVRTDVCLRDDENPGGIVFPI